MEKGERRGRVGGRSGERQNGGLEEERMEERGGGQEGCGIEGGTGWRCRTAGE